MGSVQNFILLFCVWCESRELGSRGNSRFLCVAPVVETFPDRVAFRIPPKISDGAPLQKQPTALEKQPTEMFCKKSCSQKFCKIHRKTPAPEYFFNKVRAATLFKKNTFFTEHLLTAASGPYQSLLDLQ